MSPSSRRPPMPRGGRGLEKRFAAWFEAMEREHQAIEAAYRKAAQSARRRNVRSRRGAMGRAPGGGRATPSVWLATSRDQARWWEPPGRGRLRASARSGRNMRVGCSAEWAP